MSQPHSASVDVVVVGSGFGGAVVAARAAAAGLDVVVLERGRHWAGQDFPRAIAQVASHGFWSDGRSHGFVEYVAFRNVDVIQGAGVGGGSLHYFNVNLPADERVFADRRWPAAITRQSLDPYYELARSELGSAPLVPPPGRTALPPRTTAFLAAATRAGLTVDQVPIAVHTGPAQSVPFGAHGSTQREPCTYCGNCLFGCDIGAKRTLDTTYLAQAEHAHGAAIRPLHLVEGIARTPDGYDVRYRALDADDPTAPGTPGSVRARVVVVAAGAIGSTALLLGCRDRQRSLPSLPAALGNSVSLNGEILFAFADRLTAETDPGIGPPITARATVRTSASVITVEDLGLPDALFWYAEGALPPPGGRFWALGRLAASYAQRALGIGGRSNRLGLEVDAVVSRSRTGHSMPMLGMAVDSSDGRLRLNGGRLELEWNHRRNYALQRETMGVMRRIAAAGGGRFHGSPIGGWPLHKTVTAHPLGGCPMGDDPRSSVSNDNGEVWGHPGLFVVDGSMVPTGLAVNPSLTIAALAERASAAVVERARRRTTTTLPVDAAPVSHERSSR